MKTNKNFEENIQKIKNILSEMYGDNEYQISISKRIGEYYGNPPIYIDDDDYEIIIKASGKLAQNPYLKKMGKK